MKRPVGPTAHPFIDPLDLSSLFVQSVGFSLKLSEILQEIFFVIIITIVIVDREVYWKSTRSYTTELHNVCIHQMVLIQNFSFKKQPILSSSKAHKR